MALIDMIMPKMGESIMECTVITWLKKPGDRIEADESVVEVATDKVDTDVPSLHNGVLKEWLVQEGDVVAVGAPIARIDVAETAEKQVVPRKDDAPGSDTTTAPKNPAQTPVGIGDVANVPHEPAQNDVSEPEVTTAVHEIEATISGLSSRPVVAEKAVATSATTLADNSSGIFSDRFYSPLVLTIAKEEKVSRDELDRIPGSGADNRVTKKDILGYVIDRAEGRISAVPTQPDTASAPRKATRTSTASGCRLTQWADRYYPNGPDAEDDCATDGGIEADGTPRQFLC